MTDDSADRMPLFEEVQTFPTWGYAVVLAGTIIGVAAPVMASRAALGFAAGLVPGMALVANLLLMRTSVDTEEVTVTFGWLFPLYRRRIRRADIASAEAVTYSPLGEYGGWGIRGMSKDVALNARGNRGVRLRLTSGNRVLIGSQRPEELAAALIEQAR